MQGVTLSDSCREPYFRLFLLSSNMHHRRFTSSPSSSAQIRGTKSCTLSCDPHLHAQNFHLPNGEMHWDANRAPQALAPSVLRLVSVSSMTPGPSRTWAHSARPSVAGLSPGVMSLAPCSLLQVMGFPPFSRLNNMPWGVQSTPGVSLGLLVGAGLVTASGVL